MITKGMADIIAAHRYSLNRMGCVCGGWDRAEGAPSHSDHVAEELTQAGYGSLQDFQPEYGAREMHFGGLSKEPRGHGPVRDPRWMDKSTHVRMIGPWVELKEVQVDAA